MQFTIRELRVLTTDQRQPIEAMLGDFQLGWTQDSLSKFARTATDAGHLCTLVFEEATRIDLLQRWTAGERPVLESYVNKYPEIWPTTRTVSPDLILAEIAIRSRFETVCPDEFEQRFPQQFAFVKQASSQEKLVTQLFATETACISKTQQIAESFGRYTIERQIGRGGMGQVYEAFDNTLQRKVAIKIPMATSADPQLVKRLLLEATVAGALRHPNICPIYDAGIHEQTPFIAMAFIDGRPLSDFISDDKLAMSVSASAGLVRDVAYAVDMAHQCGVVHCDLKPSNIMVEQDGTPVVTDFGLAQFVNRPDAFANNSGAPVGTPAYMPPEQVNGDTDAIGVRSDVYSLGVVLYELLTGRLPFDGSYSQVLNSVLTATPPSITEISPGVPSQLAAVCERAMSKRRDDRFAGAKEFANAIDEAVNAVTDDPPIAGNRWKNPILAVIGIACLFAVGMWVWQQGTADNEGPVAGVTTQQRAVQRKSIRVADSAGFLAAVEKAHHSVNDRIAYRIELEPGNYDFGKQCWQDQISGFPNAPTEIVGADPENPPVIHGNEYSLAISGAEHFVLSNLVFNDAGLVLQYCNDFTVQNVSVVGHLLSDIKERGILLEYCHRFRLLDSSVIDFSPGWSICLKASQTGIVHNCYVRAPNRDGLGDDDSIGLLAYAGSRSVWVSRCEFHGTERAMQLGGRQSLDLSDPVMVATCQEYYLTTQTYEASQVVASNNLVVGAKDGVVLNSCKDCSFTNNIIYESEVFPIRALADGFNKLSPIDNRIEGNIFVQAASSCHLSQHISIAPPVRIGKNAWYFADDPANSMPQSDAFIIDEQVAGVMPAFQWGAADTGWGSNEVPDYSQWMNKTPELQTFGIQEAEVLPLSLDLPWFRTQFTRLQASTESLATTGHPRTTVPVGHESP